MSDLVYVSGHRNPDTDSICSAIAYSYLLNATNKYNAVPVRLGEINRETEYVLKRFGVEHPVLLKTVKQKVEDLNYDKVTVFSKDLTQTDRSFPVYGETLPHSFQWWFMNIQEIQKC